MSSMKTLLLSFILLCSVQAASQPLRIVTEKLPPLQFIQNDGIITGAMVDVVNLLLKKANIKGDIEVLP